MNSPTLYLSALVLLAAAFPSQLARIGMMLAGQPDTRRRPRAVVVQLWLPVTLTLVAGLAWELSPVSGLATLPGHWWWYPLAVAVGLAAPWWEVGAAAAPALLRGRRVRRVRLTDRWPIGGGLVLVGALVAAVAEEVIFRGVGLHLLAGPLGWPVAVAVAVTAVVYGLNHLYFGLPAVAQKTLTGVAYGVLYVACGYSVWIPVLAHLTQNLVVLIWGRWRR